MGKYQLFPRRLGDPFSAQLYLKRIHTDKIQASGSSWFWFFWPLAVWNFLSAFKGDKHLLWKPKHVCNDSSLWHRQETLNCFCVNKVTVMNSHTSSNQLNKNFYSLLLRLRESGNWSPNYVCDWWAQNTISPKLSVCHLQKHNCEAEQSVCVTWHGKEFYTPQLAVRLRRPISI